MNKKYLIICIGILIFGIFVNQLSSYYLSKKYSDNLPVLNDFLLDKLPYLRIQWFYDLIPLTALLFFVLYSIKYKFESAPYILLIFGVTQLVRGIFIFLTPLGSPLLNYDCLRLFDSRAFRFGVYPSGHTLSTFLCYLLTDNKRYKMLFLILTLLLIVSLLLGRGHYSIDIFSALIFDYAIYSYLEKHFNKLKGGKNG